MTRAQPTLARWGAVVGSLAGVATAAVLTTGWLLRDRLPNRVASHWGSNGVDEVASLPAYLSIAAALLIGTTAVLAVVAWRAPMEIRRVLGAIQGGMSWVLGAALLGSLATQADLTDPYRAADPGVWFAVGLVPGALAATLAWRLLPVRPAVTPAGSATDPSNQAVGASVAGAGAAATVPVRVGEQLTWWGRTPVSGGPLVAVGLLVAIAVGLAWQASAWVAIVPLLVGVGVIWMCRASVVVDRHGLRVSSRGRVTWMRIPLERIRVAEVDEVRPLAQFGGYGLRWGVRGKGFVTRSGTAVRVDTSDGTSTWVSLDDAAQAAATLNTLAATQHR